MNHPQDKERIERDHSDFTDRIGDAAIALQDAAYKLGCERGKKEATDEVIGLLVKCRQSINGTRQQLGEGLDDETRSEINGLDDLIIEIDSFRAKHKGAAS